ncbi:MAG: hypothetical protein KC454_04545 [Flavobacteriales bacterium]|nr:hypothetical protein [Flavobacteriales bacterium]
METKDITLVSFYQLLGRVFYATAQADKVIRPEEVSELKQIVKNVWLDADNAKDEFNSDAAFQIEIVFDFLLENEIIVEGIINQVESFKSIHTSLFTKNTIELIMKTALDITSSFAKSNKSEVVFLSQLRLALEK